MITTTRFLTRRRHGFFAISLACVLVGACGSEPERPREDFVVPLSRLVAASADAGVEAAAAEVQVTTPPEQWAYAAVANLANRPAYTGPVRIAVTARTTEGMVGVGVLNTSRTDFLVEEQVPVSDSNQEVLLFVRSIGDASDLVVRNTAPDGAASVALIQQVKITPD